MDDLVSIECSPEEIQKSLEELKAEHTRLVTRYQNFEKEMMARKGHLLTEIRRIELEFEELSRKFRDMTIRDAMKRKVVKGDQTNDQHSK